VLERATGEPWWGSRLAGIVAATTVLLAGGRLFRAPDSTALERTGPVLAWAVTDLVALSVRAWAFSVTIEALARYAGFDWSANGRSLSEVLRHGHPAAIAASIAAVVVTGPAGRSFSSGARCIPGCGSSYPREAP